MSKISVNEKFFDTWNPESCYVFGFLLADGSLNISEIPRRVSSGEYHTQVRKYVSFDNGDKNVIEQIKRSMGAIQKIYKRSQISKKGNTGVTYELHISNKYLITRLEQLGVEPRKSTKPMNIPESIPDSLFHHFFRGYFDGDGYVADGTIAIVSNSVNKLNIQIIARFTMQGLPIPHERHYVPNNGSFELTKLLWHVREHRRILYNWIYREASMFSIIKREKTKAMF